MYTTNTIENLNRLIRKVTKNKTIFPTDFSLEKSLYLAITNATSKWTTVQVDNKDERLGSNTCSIEYIL